MVDKITVETRSRTMSKIHGKNTRMEVLIRKALHKRRFRYRIYDNSLPGKPDIILPKYKAVILINGCFWHGHNCYLFNWPTTHPEFWKTKITGNQERDKKNIYELEKMGWRVLIIWGCSYKGKLKLPFDLLIDQISVWLTTNSESNEILHT